MAAPLPNFGRPHMMLSQERHEKCTPAMAIGLEEKTWTFREMVERSTQS
jgi:hypothetical protein